MKTSYIWPYTLRYGDPRHGLNGYTNLGCRCAECKAAKASWDQTGRTARTVRLAADPALRPHGVYQTYVKWGCRCTPCTAANTAVCAFNRRRRAAP